jgi:hypothetical protein
MVYKGTLHQISSGKEIKGDIVIVHRPWYSKVVTRHVRYDGWIQRSFIRIGDTDIRNALVRPEWDDYLAEAVGQEVEMSVGGPEKSTEGRHPVAALRTPRAGLLRPTTAYLNGAVVGAVFRSALASVLYGLIAILICWLIFGRIIGAAIGSMDTGAVIGLVLGALCIPFIFFKQVQFTYNWKRQCTALD